MIWDFDFLLSCVNILHVLVNVQAARRYYRIYSDYFLFIFVYLLFFFFSLSTNCIIHKRGHKKKREKRETS